MMISTSYSDPSGNYYQWWNNKHFITNDYNNTICNLISFIFPDKIGLYNYQLMNLSFVGIGLRRCKCNLTLNWGTELQLAEYGYSKTIRVSQKDNQANAEYETEYPQTLTLMLCYKGAFQ